MYPTLSYATAIVLALLGVRLLAQAVRLQKAAEGWLGGFLLLAGGGMGTALIGVHDYLAGDAASYDITRWSMLAVTVGMCAYVEFVRRSFRPDATWAKGLSALLCAAMFAGWYQVMFKLAYGHLTEPHPMAFGPRMLAYSWGIVESFLAYRTHKKRMAIGLADPVVVNRFLLFVIWNLLVIAAPAANAFLRKVNPDAVAVIYRVFPWLFGSCLAVVTVLIFFPPSAYLDRLTRGYKDELEAAT